jgi:DNA-binding transcriptional MerR regulator
MAKLIDGQMYLSPMEASSSLRVSYRTLQRWAESGIVSVWVGTNGSRKKKKMRMRIDYLQTPTGYRYYKREAIDRLAEELQV